MTSENIAKQKLNGSEGLMRSSISVGRNIQINFIHFNETIHFLIHQSTYLGILSKRQFIYLRRKTISFYNIYICRVHIMIRVKTVKRIFIWIKHYCYAIEEIFTIITEFDK